MRCAMLGSSRRSARAPHRRSGCSADRSRHRHSERSGTLAMLEIFAGSARRRPVYLPRRSSSARPSTSAPTSSCTVRRPAVSTRHALPPPRSDRLPTAARVSPAQAVDNMPLGLVLLNLSDPGGHRSGGARQRPPACRRAPAPLRLPVLPGLCDRQPGPGAAAARRLGRRRRRPHPGRRLRRAGDIGILSCHRAGWRRCAATPTPPRPFGALRDLRVSEDPQDQAIAQLVDAFTAAARQPRDPLRHARDSSPTPRPRHQYDSALGLAAGRPRRSRSG